MSKRILMIGWEYPPNNSGGLGVASQGIVEHLVDAGQDLLLVLPSEMNPERTTLFFVSPGGRSYPVIFIPSSLKPYVTPKGKSYNGNLIDDVYRFARDVVLAVADEEFDLIHVHDWLTVPAGILLMEKFKKALMMHVHSTEYDRTAGNAANIEVEKIEKEGFEKSDFIAAVSGYTKKILIEKYGVSQEKIEVVHNGIDDEKSRDHDMNFLGNAPMVLFVGRLTVQKGPEHFIRMAKTVLRKVPETIFVVAGNGDMQQRIIEDTAFAEITGSVLFSGFLRGEAKDRLYARADIFVMPSISEPFGLVALEAAQFKKPVIVSKTSGVAEVLPSAITVDFWDTDLIAEEIIELVNNPEKRNVLGEAVRAETGLVTWERTADQLINIYNRND